MSFEYLFDNNENSIVLEVDTESSGNIVAEDYTKQERTVNEKIKDFLDFRRRKFKELKKVAERLNSF